MSGMQTMPDNGICFWIFRIETVRYGNRRTLNRSIREQAHSSSEGRYARTGRRLLSEGGDLKPYLRKLEP